MLWKTGTAQTVAVEVGFGRMIFGELCAIRTTTECMVYVEHAKHNHRMHGVWCMVYVEHAKHTVQVVLALCTALTSDSTCM